MRWQLGLVALAVLGLAPSAAAEGEPTAWDAMFRSWDAMASALNTVPQDTETMLRWGEGHAVPMVGWAGGQGQQGGENAWAQLAFALPG